MMFVVKIDYKMKSGIEDLEWMYLLKFIYHLPSGWRL